MQLGYSVQQMTEDLLDKEGSATYVHGRAQRAPMWHGMGLEGAPRATAFDGSQ